MKRIEEELQLFEKFVGTMKPQPSLDRKTAGTSYMYLDPDTQKFWMGWLGRAAHEEQKVIDIDKNDDGGSKVFKRE